jgi:hypothetical protein
MAKLRENHVTIAREMLARQVLIRRIAGQLGVDESTVHYRLARPADAPDGRRARRAALDGRRSGSNPAAVGSRTETARL